MALQNSYFWQKTCQKSSNFTEGWTVTYYSRLFKYLQSIEFVSCM